MPRIYVANPTIQNQRVFYRLDFNGDGQRNPGLRTALKFKDIAPGQQEAVGGDLAHPMQVGEIVQQLQVYGGMDASEANRQNGFVTYLYSVDKPVPKATVMKVHNFNQGVQVADGKRRRVAAALAASEILNNTVAEDSPPPFTVEFEQEEVSEAGEKAIGEGYHVVAEPIRGDQPPRQKRAYTRKAA